jgi:hypothetical protein
MTLWRIRSREIDEVVQADDQWEAWDSLRDRSAFDFGLIATAEPNESADPIPVHTATLMRRWDREKDAEAFDEVARQAGLIS